MTRPFGLQPDDLVQVMGTFGVAEARVRRDHAISHILAALSRHRREELIFFGGTALSRTYLLDERLSEDLDLVAVDHQDGLADALRKDINAPTHGDRGRGAGGRAHCVGISGRRGLVVGQRSRHTVGEGA